MPRVTVKVHGTYESITRPIALGVARDVMAATEMDERKVTSTLLGEFGYKEQPGSKMGDDGQLQFGSGSQVTLTMEDNPRYESILSTHVRSKEHPPILADRRLGIGVYPVYVDSEITLHFKYEAASKEEALKWRDDYMIKRAEDRSVLYHELMYYIPIQDGVFELLYHLWELRERISGYGDSFDDYIEEMRCRELTTLTRVDGDLSTASIAVPERQIQVTGWFDFNEPPKEEKEQGTVRWNIEFSYKVLYKRCTHFYLVYPMAVHQTHIGRKYFTEETYYSFEDMNPTKGIRVMCDEVIRKRMTPINDYRDAILRWPAWDDWIPSVTSDSSLSRMRPMFNWLVGLNPEDPKKILDLTTIPEIRLSLEIEEFLRATHTRLTKRRESIVYLRLYKGDIPVEDEGIYVDEDLVLRSHNGLDLRELYHVRWNFIISPTLMSERALDDLRRHPLAAWLILKTLNVDLDDKRFSDWLVSDKILKDGYIEQELHEIESRDNGANMTSEGNYSGASMASEGNYSNPKNSMGVWSKRSTMKSAQSLLIVSKRGD